MCIEAMQAMIRVWIERASLQTVDQHLIKGESPHPHQSLTEIALVIDSVDLIIG